MDTERDRKRKSDRRDDADEDRRERRPKRAKSRSKSPRERVSRRKRRHSKSLSPNVPVKQEKTRDSNGGEVEVKKEPPQRRAKETDMLNTRTGGAYIPPARLRMMQAEITDKSSVAYQRLAWEALKKSIHGHINKINVGNIGIIIKELLKENIVRGRGLLSRSVIQAQAASPTFTNVYAALVAAVNSRFPNIGELLLKRLVIQFKRGFKRNDKPTCISSASFIAHLVNQRVAHEILALELLTLLVETPTDDSVEVAIAFLKECGQKLTEVSSKGVNAIFEMLRNILHEGQLDKRVQYMIEVMFQVWKDGFKDHPSVIEELELVPEEEQFTHLLMLDEATDPQDILNVFKFDDKYEENEQKYKDLSKEILGSDAESGDEEGSGSESGSEDEEDDDEEEAKPVTIIDNTETNLIALRRTIYLTINSSLDFEECAHKLLKMQLKPGQEAELCHMFLDCCAEQRTYEKFYGLLAQRFCNINRIYIGPFEDIFKDSYATAHRLDTNRLRNVSKFFAHLLFTDSISWEVLECVKLNEEDTTSSSRIYIKILFQELAEYMGLKKLNDRLKDPTLQGAFSGVFPRDNPKNTRFSINFFTSIGLGGLTDELREHLKQMPKNVPPPATEIRVASSSESSSSDSSSSSSSSSSSDSDSDEENGRKKKKKTKDNKKKNKDKTPKTPEEAEGDDGTAKKDERWGHDGFYDTYGQDARRHERNRDDDVFVRPRDRTDQTRDNRNRDRDDDRRAVRNYDRNRDRNDERPRDRNDDRSRDQNDARWSEKQDDERNRDRDGDRRRDKNDDERSRDRNDERRKDKVDDRMKEKERDNDRRTDRNDDRRKDNDNSSRRDRNDDDRRRDKDDEYRRRDKNDERVRDRESDDDRRDKDRIRDKENRNDKDRNERRKDDDDDDSRRKERDGDRRRGRNDERRREKNDDGYESRISERESDRSVDRYKRDEKNRNNERNGDKNDKSRTQRGEERDRGDKRETRDREDRSKKYEKTKAKSVKDERSDENDSDSNSSESDDNRETVLPSYWSNRDKYTSNGDTRERDRKSDDKPKKETNRHDEGYESKSKRDVERKGRKSVSSSEEGTPERKVKKKSKKDKKNDDWDIKNKKQLDKSAKKSRKSDKSIDLVNDEWDIKSEKVVADRYWGKKTAVDSD